MRPVERAYGAIHDLTHIGDLDADPCRLLCVSDRTLYILQNWAALEAEFSARYGTEFVDGYYQPVDIDQPEWSLFRETVENLQLEVNDMSCDIQAGLNAIAAAIAGLEFGSSGCSSTAPAGECIATIPNEDFEGSPEQDPGSEGGGDPPPDGFDTWEEYYVYKCSAAGYIWQILKNAFAATMGLAGLQLTAAIIVPVFAGLTGMLPAVFTPVGFIAFVTAILGVAAISAVAFAEAAQMVNYLDENKQDIICALYESGNSVEAVSAVSTIIEDAIQFIIWPEALLPVSAALNNALGLAFANLATNNVVEPLFKVIVDVSQIDVDCDPCETPGGACEGTFTFDSDIEHAVPFYQVSCVWDGAVGHDAVGSCRSTTESGAGKEGWTRFICPEEQLIDGGTGISVHVRIVGGENARVRLKVVATDSSYYDTVETYTQGAWIVHLSDLSTLQGKNLASFSIIAHNGTTAQSVQCWIDDIIVDL